MENLDYSTTFVLLKCIDDLFEFVKTAKSMKKNRTLVS